MRTLLCVALLSILLTACATPNPIGGRSAQQAPATVVTECDGYVYNNVCYRDYATAMAAANAIGAGTWLLIIIIAVIVGVAVGFAIYKWKADGAGATIAGIGAAGVIILLLWLVLGVPAALPAAAPPIQQPQAAATAQPPTPAPPQEIVLRVEIEGRDVITHTVITTDTVIKIPAAPASGATAAPADKTAQPVGPCVIHTQEIGRNPDEHFSQIDPAITILWDPKTDARVEVTDKNITDPHLERKILVIENTAAGNGQYIFDNWTLSGTKYSDVIVDYTAEPGRVDFVLHTEDIPPELGRLGLGRAGHTVIIDVRLNNGTRCRAERYIDP